MRAGHNQITKYLLKNPWAHTPEVAKATGATNSGIATARARLGIPPTKLLRERMFFNQKPPAKAVPVEQLPMLSTDLELGLEIRGLKDCVSRLEAQITLLKDEIIGHKSVISYLEKKSQK